MTKVVTVVLALAVCAHLIRPFGWPGLRRRGDAWKLVVLAAALVVGVALLRPDTALSSEACAVSEEARADAGGEGEAARPSDGRASACAPAPATD